MGEEFERIILKQSPNWKDGRGTVLLDPMSSEFMEISSEIAEVCLNSQIRTIRRNENLYQFGQFLLEEQRLLHLNRNETFYRIRRYFKISNCHLEQVLKYNLDQRRIGFGQLQFHQKIHNIATGDIILALQVITKDLSSPILIPNGTADYYIEYIIDF